MIVRGARDNLRILLNVHDDKQIKRVAKAN